MPQSLTVQSVNSDEPIDKQKGFKIVCKLDKILKLGWQTKYYIETLKTNFPNICHGSFKHECKLD